MKYLPIILLLFLSAITGAANAQYEVTVVVPKVKSIKGTMMVCLVAEKSEYLKDCYKGAQTKVISAENTTTFTDVPGGEYAVTIFHDKNEDEKLNTNFIGIPKEPYGFSNNPMAMFGPPSYEKCLFTVDKDVTITVKL